MGVVIGETAVIGNRVKLYQGVGLVARSLAAGQALRERRGHTRDPLQDALDLAAQAGVRYSIENPQSYLSSNVQGSWNIIDLAERITAPLLITFHTILAEPSPSQLRIMQKSIALASGMMVMSPRSLLNAGFEQLYIEGPELDVRLLIWKSPLVIAASQGFFPQRAQQWFRKRMVEFRLDQPSAMGACHHQKVVIIDDEVAFCGGGDVSTDRWDSDEHLHGGQYGGKSVHVGPFGPQIMPS